MSTKIYGMSDDLIEFDGEIAGEFSYYESDDESSQGVLIACSDGTLLEVKYGKNDKGIWEVKLIERGSLFDRIEICTDENKELYSDVAYFNDGLKWTYAAPPGWDRVG